MSTALHLNQVFARVPDHAPEDLNAPNHSAATKIEFGDFHIDLVRRTATLRGRELDLTPEEFDVLVFLAGHPQSMITPHTVLSTRAPRIRQTEFLRTMLSLRSKIHGAAAEPGRHYLRTESWVVYRFDPTASTP